MQRVINELEYVLKVLHQARQEVIAHPTSFEPDALKRIDKVIAENVIAIEDLAKQRKAA